MVSLMDLYDEEFNRHLNLAKNLIGQLKTKEDREICTKWIRKLISLKTKDIAVKRNRNAFFKYLLTVLQTGVTEDAEQPGYDDMYGKPLKKKKSAAAVMSRWSPDKRTYVAAKPLPGRGALVYMAVAKDPLLGWDFPNKKYKPNAMSQPE